MNRTFNLLGKYMLRKNRFAMKLLSMILIAGMLAGSVSTSALAADETTDIVVEAEAGTENGTGNGLPADEVTLSEKIPAGQPADEATLSGGASEVLDPEDVPEVTNEVEYATLDDFNAAYDAMGDAGDEASILAVLDNIEAVYARLPEEDKAAVAEQWAYIQDYRASVDAGNPDEGIEPEALLIGEEFSIKVNYGYLDDGTFHLLESRTMVSTCRYGCGHCGYDHTMDASAIVTASGYSGNWRVTRYGYWDSPASTTNCNYSITGSAPYKADQTIWVYGEKPTIENPEQPGTSTTPGASGSGSYFLQVVYVNKAKTEYTFGPRIASNTTLRIWYYDNAPQAPAGYELKGWQSSHYHGDNGFLTKAWWPIDSGSPKLTETNGYNRTVVLNSGEGVYLIYEGDPVSNANTFTLTYNANGGTVNGQSSYENEVTTSESSYDFGYIEPERDGYDFQGWYTVASGGSKVDWPKTLDTSNKTSTVYAHWIKKSDVHENAIVKYENGGGNGGPVTETVPGSKNYTIKSIGAVGITGPDGKVFSHWELSGTQNKYFPGDTFVPADGSTNTFVAVWKDDDSQTGDTEYKVQWFDADTNNAIKDEETRKGTLGSPVSVTALDKRVSGYTYASTDTRNLESAILEAGTVLKLYFAKDANPVIDNRAGISIVKTRTSITDSKGNIKTKAEAGDTITWSIMVTNNSNVEKIVTLIEKLDGARLSKSEVTLKPAGEEGASETVTATYTVTGSETVDANGMLFNTVSATTHEEGEKENPEAKDEGTKITPPNPEKVIITVKFVDEDGNVVGTETVEVDKDSEYDVTEETKKIPEGYVSNGNPTGDPVTGEADGNKIVTVPVKAEMTPSPAPVDPAPVDPTPVDPTPVDPTPVNPIPVDPIPADPTPDDPAPEAPAPVAPAPVAAVPAPVAPVVVPVAPTVVPPAAPEEEPEVEIEENEPPLAAPERQPEEEEAVVPAAQVEIEDEELPLAAGNGRSWALVNFALMNLAVFETLMLLIGYFVNTKKEEEKKLKKKGIVRLVSLPVAIISIIVFCLTEDITLPTGFVDRWTIWMAVIAVAQTVLAAFSRKKEEEETEKVRT